MILLGNEKNSKFKKLFKIILRPLLPALVPTPHLMYLSQLFLFSDCYKLGGFDILLKYLDDSNSTLQWKALSVLGSCLQNNTFCQDQALKLNILPRFLKMVDGEYSDSQVNVKALYALGCKYCGLRLSVKYNYAIEMSFMQILKHDNCRNQKFREFQSLQVVFWFFWRGKLVDM